MQLERPLTLLLDVQSPIASLFLQSTRYVTTLCRKELIFKVLMYLYKLFPELYFDGSLACETPDFASVLKASPPMAGSLASPVDVYYTNDNKKRRIAKGDEQAFMRGKQVLRLCRSSEVSQTQQLSPSLGQRMPLGAKNHW